MVKFKKYICIFTICLFSFVSVARPNLEAKAIGTAIASFFAAIPISWPVIAGVLIAGGVGTAAWYSTWEPEEQERFVTEVKGRLLEAQLTLGQLVGNVGSTIINGADYVRGSIVDGLCYLGENILDIIWDVADEFSMLGGGDMTISDFSPPDLLEGFEFTASNTTALSPMVFFQTLDLSVFGFNTIVYNNLVNLFENVIPDGSYIHVTFQDQYNIGVGWCPLSVLFGKQITSKSVQDIGRFNRYFIEGDSSALNYSYAYSDIYRDNNITVSSNYTYLGAIRISQYVGDLPIYLSWNTYRDFSNLNIDDAFSIENEGSAPVGEKGQVTAEQDGAWSVPWASDAAKVIDNVGKALPVSIPHSAEWGVDVPATWDIDVAVPDSLVLPLAEAITRALNPPISITQDVAQEGVIDPPVAVPDVSPVVPDVGQFIVPSFIKDRFPFCIPFDLVRAAKSLSASNTPPEFVYDFHYGENGVYTFRINFAQFESYIQLFRTAELILFVVSLIAGTRQIMKE